MAQNETVAALTYDQIIAAIDEHGSERKAAIALGVPRSTLQDHLKALKAALFQTKRMQDPIELPASDKVRYFILSSAQDGSRPHVPFLRNLEKYAKHLDARIFISGFTYNKALFEDHAKTRAAYALELLPYLTQQRINIGSGLMFCGEQNTLPTAVNPLSGFDSYTGMKWGIFPHPKVHLKTIPTAKTDPVKIIMTTGAITLPNYVQKKAGIKAEFHHEIGAVLVALMPDGTFFCRHLLAEPDGSFQDLTVRVQDGSITKGHRVESITWGDIHHEKRDDVIFHACWGIKPHDEWKEGEDFVPMVDFLRPKSQFLHDVIDFEPRNHHNISDPHFRFKMFVTDKESVRDGIKNAALFVKDASRPNCVTYVVESNHDLALLRWLKTADYRSDPVNARFFLELQHRIYTEYERGNFDFQVLPWIIQEFWGPAGAGTEVYFLSEDDSVTIANGIECAMHGHLGANGARASAVQFSRMGRRSNTAHSHTAVIFDGNYQSGVSGKLDMGYNKGLSSWSHSHIITYPSGKRTLLTQLSNGAYCEQQVCQPLHNVA